MSSVMPRTTHTERSPKPVGNHCQTITWSKDSHSVYPSPQPILTQPSLQQQPNLLTKPPAAHQQRHLKGRRREDSRSSRQKNKTTKPNPKRPKGKRKICMSLTLGPREGHGSRLVGCLCVDDSTDRETRPRLIRNRGVMFGICGTPSNRDL